MAGLVDEALVPSETSDAVSVRLPAVRKVTLADLVPATSEPLAGRAALASLEARATVSVTLLTRFQLASTARIVTVRAAPAVWVVGVPVLPVAVPGAAASPGTRSCNLTKAPVLTVIAGLLLAVRVPDASLAVTVLVPAVLKVRLDSVRVPETRVKLPAVAPLSSAMLALGSEVVSVTFGVAPGTTFQLASTALTTLPFRIALPAVSAVGVPVLPVVVPGAAVSPGNRSCNFVTAPALTTIEGLVELWIAGVVRSLAVTVALPAVLNVMLKVAVPLVKAALAGVEALGSLNVIPIESLVCRTFQKLSTALTVTVKAVPAF